MMSPLVPRAELDEALAALDRAREALPHVECPECGTSIRARMADADVGALRPTVADDYRIALRDDDNGDLDDVVVNDVSTFRAERLSKRDLSDGLLLPRHRPAGHVPRPGQEGTVGIRGDRGA